MPKGERRAARAKHLLAIVAEDSRKGGAHVNVRAPRGRRGKPDMAYLYAGGDHRTFWGFPQAAPAGAQVYTQRLFPC